MMSGPKANWSAVVEANAGKDYMDPFYEILDQLPEEGTVHWRWYLSTHTNQPVLVCVQDFDYPDYIPARFLDDVAYLSEYEALN
jgi:hypothetical protein